MSNPISDFYDVIWTFRKGNETIDALFSGELSLDSYAEMLYNKRRAYDACVLECCINVNDRYNLSVIFDRLTPQLSEYSNYDFNKKVKEGTREYWELEYHKIRHKELSIAIKNTKDLMSSSGVTFGRHTIIKVPSKTKDEDSIGYNFYFRGLYTDEQLEVIYDHLLYRYLHNETQFEDFVYYMTGRGDKIPTDGMIWVKDNVDLAHFIDAFFSEHNKRWKIAEMIFGKKRLASAYYQTPQENPFKQFKKDKVDILKIRR